MGTPIPNPVCQTQNFHERPSRIKNKLKQSLLCKLAKTNPSISITSVHGSYIDTELQKLFQSFSTPKHPPYALMILNAVMELNEEGGSCKNDISGFIERVFEDLPWAHQTILGYHLRKLCENQELLRTECGKYMLSPLSSDPIAGREVGMGKRVTSEFEFGESKDDIVERREEIDEIDGKTASPDSQIKDAAERSGLQERGLEQVNKKVRHSSKEHPQQHAEEHLEVKEDQVQVAEAQTEQERQASGVTDGQIVIAMELCQDMLKDGEKLELIREPDEEEANVARTDVRHGEWEVSKKKGENTSEMWDLTAQNLDEKKLKPDMHLPCGIPDAKTTTHICPNVDLASFDYTSKLAAALHLERTARSQSFPGKWNENGNMDMSVEMFVTAADAAKLEQQATPVHTSFNQMQDIGLGGETGRPSRVPDEEQTSDSPIQLQCELGDGPKESTAAATSDYKQEECPELSGMQMPDSGTQHCHEPCIGRDTKRGRSPKQKLDVSPVLALFAPKFCSSEYHGHHQSQPRKRGRPRTKRLDSEDAGDIGDGKESAPSVLDFNCDVQGHPQSRQGRPCKQNPGSEPAVIKHKLKIRGELRALSSEYRKKLRLRNYIQSKGSDLENPTTSEKDD